VNVRGVGDDFEHLVFSVGFFTAHKPKRIHNDSLQLHLSQIAECGPVTRK
jgi:hypothetical protein